MNEVEVVLAWHEALNAGDVNRLAALTDDAVEVEGPHGTARGGAIVRDWAERAGVRLEPGRVFRRGEAVVAEEVARWRDRESGEWGEPLRVASGFRVGGGRVGRVARFGELGAALAAFGLAQADEVAGGRR